MAKQIFHKIKSNFASIVTNRGFNRSHRPKDGSIRKKHQIGYLINT